jgi:hypothetical protein
MKEKEIKYKLKNDDGEQDEDTMYLDSQEEIDQIEKISSDRLEKELSGEGGDNKEWKKDFLQNYNINL